MRTTIAIAMLSMLLTPGIGHAEPPAGFVLRHTNDGRSVAVWEGQGMPDARALKQLLFGRTRSNDGVNRLATDAVDAIALDSLGNLPFGFGSAVLGPESRGTLTEICQAFSSDPDMRQVKFRVIGHTCAIGVDGRNLSLSERRATSVASFLASCFGSVERIVAAEGRGELDPLREWRLDAPQQRRVELGIVKPYESATGTFERQGERR